MLKLAAQPRYIKARYALLFEKAEVLSIPLFFKVFGRYKPQGGAIDAVAHSLGRRSIVEQMPQMAVAMPAADFGARHE